MRTNAERAQADAEYRIRRAADAGFAPVTYDAETKTWIAPAAGSNPRHAFTVACAQCGKRLAIRSSLYMHRHQKKTHGNDMHHAWIVGRLFEAIRYVATDSPLLSRIPNGE